MIDIEAKAHLSLLIESYRAALRARSDVGRAAAEQAFLRHYAWLRERGIKVWLRVQQG